MTVTLKLCEPIQRHTLRKLLQSNNMHFHIPTSTSLVPTLLATIPTTNRHRWTLWCYHQSEEKRHAKRQKQHLHNRSARFPRQNRQLYSRKRGQRLWCKGLQGNLNECYTNNNRSKRIKVNGDFSSKTEALLKSAQRVVRNDDDGKYGPTTNKNMFVEGVATNSRGQFLATCLLPFD